MFRHRHHRQRQRKSARLLRLKPDLLYIEKPMKGPVLRALLDRALSRARDARQLAVLQRQLREAGRLGDLVGASKPMQEVMRIVEMAAPSSASVLITGRRDRAKNRSRRTTTTFTRASDRL